MDAQTIQTSIDALHTLATIGGVVLFFGGLYVVWLLLRSKTLQSTASASQNAYGALAKDRDEVQRELIKTQLALDILMVERDSRQRVGTQHAKEKTEMRREIDDKDDEIEKLRRRLQEKSDG